VSAALAGSVLLLVLGAAATVWLVFRSALRGAGSPDARSQEDELLDLRARQLAELRDDDPESRALREDLERVLVAETRSEAGTGAGRPAVRRGTVAPSDRRVMLVTLLLVPALALGTWLVRGAWPELGLRDDLVQLERAESGESHDAGAVDRLAAELESRVQAGEASPDDRFLLGRTLLVREQWDRAAAVLSSLRQDVGEAPVLDSLWLQAEFRAGVEPPSPGSPGVPANVQGRLPEPARAFARSMGDGHPAIAVGLELLAMDAVARGELPAAAGYLQRLLPRVAGTPREASIRAGLDRMAELLGGLPEPPPEAVAGAAPDADGPAATGTTVRVSVELAPGYAPAEGATVFVFARAPGGGPPLAARRLTAGELPVLLELSDADAMIPGRNLSSAEGFEVLARLSSDGSPQGRPDDPVARSGLLEGAPADPVTLRLAPANRGAGP
jgi:cytochrome c-type biogenesis protein CcmH